MDSDDKNKIISELSQLPEEDLQIILEYLRENFS